MKMTPATYKNLLFPCMRAPRTLCILQASGSYSILFFLNDPETSMSV